MHRFEALLRKRIALLDGAMGTMIQRARLAEEDYRGARFRDWPRSCAATTIFFRCRSRGSIRDIHAQYLQAGADVIETNTFNSTSIALADYGMQALARAQPAAANLRARRRANGRRARPSSRDLSPACSVPRTRLPPFRPMSTIRAAR